MADEKKEGLKAAVDHIGVTRFDLRQAEQLSLLPSEAVQRDVEQGAEERAGPGRPRGSKNRRTEEWTDFILSRYPSPLSFLAEAYSRPVDELAKELGCKKVEAFDTQVKAAKELAPYVHQKQPVGVQVDQRGVVSLVIETSDEVAQAVGAGRPGDGATVIEGEIVDDEDDASAEEGENEND